MDRTQKPLPRVSSLSLFLLVLGFCALVTAPFSLLAGDREKRLPLDLPAGVGGLNDEEGDEDLTESILFLGNEYQGDSFVWVLDVSGSMATGNRLQILVDEVRTSVQSLSASSEFGLVRFSNQVTAYKERPERARGNNKAAADAWLQTLYADGLTCMADGMVKGLEIANHSRRPRVNIILVSDGVPTCGDCEFTKSAIAAANYRTHPIHTVFVGDGPGGDCLQSLIAHGGSYNQIGL